ncbi:MAG: extracellular solute-binding protein [Phycisphaerales bacterium]
MRTLIAILVALVLLPGCSKKDQKHIVLYTSVDAGVIKPVIDAYTKRTGVRVDLVTDTEATKTTGLVNRLITEKTNPRTDVWWSGETVGTVQLSNAGVLAPYSSTAAESAARASGSFTGWPLRSSKNDWYAAAPRPRVIVYSARAYPNADAAPRSFNALIESGKTVAIANPAFGTTRGHLAALYLALGREVFTDTMSKIRWRIYDGNAAVVRAVANGECELGFTDYDDYRAGLANSWPLGCSFSSLSVDYSPQAFATPGTIAMVAGAPHADLARQFIDEMLTPAVEQTLAAGEWSSWPILKSVAAPDDRFKGLTLAPVDWEKTADFLDQAANAWAESQKKH